LALGIGANTAIFSVVNGVLLTPLPYKDPSRLVVVWESKGTSSHNVVNPANYMDWHDRATSFSGLALMSWAGLTFTGDEAERVQGRAVTPDFFGVLGAAPLLGRTFRAEESRPHVPRVIVLSEALWRRRFGADRAIVGRAVPVAGGTARVVGVMPASFRPMPYGQEEYWEPMPLDWSNRARNGRYAMVVGRLRNGVTIERAQTEMSRIARQLESEAPDFDTGWGATVVQLMEQVVGGAQRTILVVLGAVSLVLLIACANVANLMLARATTRHRELAIRAALGASRWRIVRQLIVESMLLSVSASALGLLLALWGVNAIVWLVPRDLRFPRIEEAQVNLVVLLFAIAVGLLLSVVLGLICGLKASGSNLQEPLKESGRSASAGVHLQRLRGVLVVAEISLTLVLLTGAGLLIKSLVKLQRVELGFNQDKLLVVPIGAPMPKYADPQLRA